MVDHDVEECEQCGSRKFHEDDGYLYCDEGHRQSGEQREGSDNEDYGQRGRISRKKEDKVKVKPVKVYRGARAFKLFLHAYQYILWQQCYALVHKKGFAAQLWTVVRDLWTLRLSKLLARMEESQSDVPDSEGLATGEDTEAEISDEPRYGQTLVRRAGSRPTLVQTIGLCYVATLLLRQPISLSTIWRWIEKEEIVYVRAIRTVPADIRDKLPGEYHEALDTNTILQADTFQAAIAFLVKYYSVTFGLQVPSLNYKPLLFEFIKKLLLPIETYQATEMLRKKLGDLRFDFGYVTGRKRRKAVSFPETQLMALVVVAVKLLYPFDSSKLQRRPRTINEPAALSMDWPAWQSAMQKLAERTAPLTSIPGMSNLLVSDENVFQMSPEQLDLYMDWYQKTWSRDTDDQAQGSRRELLAMFPLKAVPQTLSDEISDKTMDATIDETVTEYQSLIKFNAPISNQEAMSKALRVVRPGTAYAKYRVVSELENDVVAKALYTAAAEIACSSVDTLVRAVMQTERTIAIWEQLEDRADATTHEIASGDESEPSGLPFKSQDFSGHTDSSSINPNHTTEHKAKTKNQR